MEPRRILQWSSEKGQKRSRAEKDAQSPLNPKRPKEADHDDKTMRELFASSCSCGACAETNTQDAAPHDDEGMTGQSTQSWPNTKDEDADAEMMQVVLGSDDSVHQDSMSEESTQPWANTEDVAPKDKDVVKLNDEDAAPKDEDVVAPNNEGAAPNDQHAVTPDDEGAAPNDEGAVTPNDEAEGAAPTKHYGCSKCRWHYGGCSQCKRWADANHHGYVRDNLGSPYLVRYWEILTGPNAQ